MKIIKFPFEDLEVWQKSVEFARTTINLVEKINADRKHYRLVEQLEAACTSVALNIAEGKGRYSKKEYIQSLYIARGSLYETITLLIIFHKNDWISEEQLNELRNFADEINKMLSGLISYLRSTL